MKDSYLVRGIEKNGKFKFVGVDTTAILNIAREKHDTTATASAALGRTLSAAALMSTMLKNKNDSMTLIISGNGSLGNILVTSNNLGEIKGYVNNPNADAPLKENGKLNVSGIVGDYGYVKTIMDLGLKEPYIGQTELISGEIAEDIASYFYTSEQVNTAVALGVLVDKDLSIISSGGYIIQLLPGAYEEDIIKLENSIKDKASITELMKEYSDFEDIMKTVLDDFQIEFLEKKELNWNCNCSKEKTLNVLMSLGEEELTSILEEDGQAELVCHFCNEKYQINEEELRELINELKKNHTN